ncbi:MAG: FAD-binding oxidoreductase [Actinomycetota bacterium]|nr:FAD-binding oxidoreductase [Actinomycetota bacterium]
MDGAAIPGRLTATGWQTATVVSVKDETHRAKTLRLRLEAPRPHLAGQHYVVRLTAPDGYTASRSYSVASAPDDSAEIELTVERLEDGEVSTFLHDVVEPGDELEVRGPIGGWFVWDGTTPAVLVGGGSGVVPLMAMLRQARRSGRDHPLRLVVSVRTPDDLLYADELPGPEVTVVYTRRSPPGYGRPPGRLTLADLPAPPAPDPRAYVCGSSGFADAATDLLIGSGIPAGVIRVERFGPSAIAFPQ